jgi:ribosomal protein L14
MVYKHSILPIIDNTGIRKVKVIQVYRHKRALPGDIVLTTIRTKRRVKKYVKKKINNVFVIGVKRMLYRARGAYFLRLVRNQGIVLGADNEKILGTRHRSFLTFESKRTAFVQLLRSTRVVV